MLLESLQIDIAQFTTTKVHVIKSCAGLFSYEKESEIWEGMVEDGRAV